MIYYITAQCFCICHSVLNPVGRLIARPESLLTIASETSHSSPVIASRSPGAGKFLPSIHHVTSKCHRCTHSEFVSKRMHEHISVCFHTVQAYYHSTMQYLRLAFTFNAWLMYSLTRYSLFYLLTYLLNYLHAGPMNSN